MLKFLLQDIGKAQSGARLGQLIRKQRPAILTPHFVVPTSRGAVPHVAPDALTNLTSISALYFGLEDCESIIAARSTS